MCSNRLIVLALANASMTAPALAASQVIFDQIGGSPAFLAGSSSSSQFDPATPGGVFATVDNFTVSPLAEGPASQVRLTRFQAIVTGLQNFASFDLVQSWNVQLFSSLAAAASSHIGDVYSATFSAPTLLTDGYSPLGELATFDIDAVVSPGEYWVALTMGNVGAENGTVGIRHSVLGDGPCYFAVPSQQSSFPLGNPAAYRMFGEAVPGPGASAALGVGLLLLGRRRRG
jgi:hypothetical protein